MYAVIVIMVLLVGLVLSVFLISKDLYDDIEVTKGNIDARLLQISLCSAALYVQLGHIKTKD